jgi:hypothetical protein
MTTKKLLVLGPVIAGLVAAGAGTAAAATNHPASAARPAAAAQHMKAHEATRTDRSGENPSTEPDGPGGHQDPDGQNVDHQFQGVE